MHTKYYFHCKHHVTARCPGDTRTAVSAALLVNVWTFPWFSSDPKSKYGNDGILPNPFQCSADQDPMIRGNKMPTRCNRLIFIADIIVCSTCFGHHYAHHQELESIIQVVAACRIWCFGFQVVGMVWSWGLCVRFAGYKQDTQPSAPHHTDNLKTKHQIRQAATTCIILSSSWWWA